MKILAVLVMGLFIMSSLVPVYATTLPSWTDDLKRFYEQGLITQQQFNDAVQYLIDRNIIVTNLNASQVIAAMGNGTNLLNNLNNNQTIIVMQNKTQSQNMTFSDSNSTQVPLTPTPTLSNNLAPIQNVTTPAPTVVIVPNNPNTIPQNVVIPNPENMPAPTHVQKPNGTLTYEYSNATYMRMQP